MAVVGTTRFKIFARRQAVEHSACDSRQKMSNQRSEAMRLQCSAVAAVDRQLSKAHLGICAFSATHRPPQRSHSRSALAVQHRSCGHLSSSQQSWQGRSGQFSRRVHRKHRDQQLASHRHSRLSVSAAVSRLLATSPRIILRFLLRFATRFLRPLMSGPATVIVLVVTIAGATFAAIRSRMAASTRSCGCCRGFGIQRCSLCRGAGAVGWEGKWNHQEICPSCLGKRFVSCPSCGGHFHRPTFAHSRNKSRAEILASVDGGDVDADSSFLQRLVAD